MNIKKLISLTTLSALLCSVSLHATASSTDDRHGPVIVKGGQPAEDQLGQIVVKDGQAAQLISHSTITDASGKVVDVNNYEFDPQGTIPPPAPDCLTGFEITLKSSLVDTVDFYNSPTCTPTNSGYTWYGTCMLSNGTNCASLTGGTTVVIAATSEPYPYNIGTAKLSFKGSPTSVTDNIVFPPNCSSCTYRFYNPGCNTNCACGLDVCGLCTQGPP